MSHALAYLPLLGLMTVAAVKDWRTRRLPNTLNLVVLLCGLGLAYQRAIPPHLPASLAGAAVGLALLFPAFALGALGGGDVKLLAAVGAWTGPVGVLVVLLLTTVAGGAVALLQAAQTGKLRALVQNSGLLAVNLVHARSVGADHIRQTGQQFRSIDRPLPYAVPMLMGVLAWLWAC